MITKRVSELISIDKIRNWNDGDVITITAGTGAGKSHWVKNMLYLVASERNTKILFLIHRTNCIEQFKAEIKRNFKDNTITVKSYQSIESAMLNKQVFDLSEYKYIVCDEFHYFMSDAGFNVTTDISLNRILSRTDSVRIFMSATGEYVKAYIQNKKKLETIDYKLPITYEHIKQLTFFNKDDTLNELIEDCIKSKDKAIFFIQSTEKASKLYLKYKDNCLFNCSKHNTKYSKYIDKEKISNMLINEIFEEQILITTTCLDAGVNIIDTNLKHIVCDVKDIGVLIQCLGRKRIQNKDDGINVYIRNINNKQLGGMETQLRIRIKKADFLRKHTVKEFIEEFPRDYDISKIVYDDTVEEDNKGTKKINELMYYKCKCDLMGIEVMKLEGKYGYIGYMANKFDKKGDYRLLIEDRANELEMYLERIIGIVMLKVSDRKELIKQIDLKYNGKLLKKIDTLNDAIESKDLPYKIIEFPTSKMVNGKQKKYKSAWRVEKNIDNILDFVI